MYAYGTNNPVTYSDPSGHIAISRIIGGIVGGGIGAYVGSKIAKKTKATGIKKAAIIVGCTLAGAVVGALAGPKVAKVAKKAAKAVKKKVTSKAKTLKTTKKTVKMAKPKVSSAKKVSKTKKVSTSVKNKVDKKIVNTNDSTIKTVDIELKYKEGWTVSQKAEADAKVKALSEAYTKKTKVTRKGTTASVRYKRIFGKDSVAKGYDVDHIIDLQLGGVDNIINMRPLDRSVNRSLGAQIMNAIKTYPDGTVFGMFTIM